MSKLFRIIDYGLAVVELALYAVDLVKTKRDQNSEIDRLTRLTEADRRR